MPRAGLKNGREAQEVGAAIVASWFKVLPTAVPITQVLSTTSPFKIQVQWQAFTTGQDLIIHNAKGAIELQGPGTMPLKAGPVASVTVSSGGTTQTQQTVEILDHAGNPVDAAGFATFLTDSVASGTAADITNLQTELTTTLNQDSWMFPSRSSSMILPKKASSSSFHASRTGFIQDRT